MLIDREHTGLGDCTGPYLHNQDRTIVLDKNTPTLRTTQRKFLQSKRKDQREEKREKESRSFEKPEHAITFSSNNRTRADDLEQTSLANNNFI